MSKIKNNQQDIEYSNISNHAQAIDNSIYNKGEVESKGIPTTIDDGQQFD